MLDAGFNTIPGTGVRYEGVISRVATPRFDSMGNAVSRLSVTIVVKGLPK